MCVTCPTLCVSQLSVPSRPCQIAIVAGPMLMLPHPPHSLTSMAISLHGDRPIQVGTPDGRQGTPATRKTQDCAGWVCRGVSVVPWAAHSLPWIADRKAGCVLSRACGVLRCVTDARPPVHAQPLAPVLINLRQGCGRSVELAQVVRKPAVDQQCGAFLTPQPCRRTGALISSSPSAVSGDTSKPLGAAPGCAVCVIAWLCW